MITRHKLHRPKRKLETDEMPSGWTGWNLLLRLSAAFISVKILQVCTRRRVVLDHRRDFVTSGQNSVGVLWTS
jgi:hypothetical protein